MSRITAFAEGKGCTVRIPGVCNSRQDTSVWAHIRSNRFGAGMGLKPPDVCGLIACSACHDVIDRRVKTDHDREFITLCVFDGHMESLMLLAKAGII